ncbi:MAG: hypothetical protein R3F61_32465 [Myxococcota bacterium]
MRGTLLSVVLSLAACSEYGLDVEPPGSSLASDDPSVKAGGHITRIGDLTDDEPEGRLELGDATLGGGEDPELPFFVDGTWTDTSEQPTDPEDPTNPEDPTDPEDPTVEQDGGSDPEHPPTGELPEEHPTSECDASDIAPFSSGEIWVGNSNSSPTEASGTLTAPAAGWYDVYNTPIQESGASQHNESAFFRVQNATNPAGLPATGNCGDEWVVADADNSGSPPGARTYLGTFWLDAGANTLVMTHYCQIWTSCPQFHNDQPSNQTCDSGNINSVHFLGDGVCLEAL